jgi:hypothetical protein
VQSFKTIPDTSFFYSKALERLFEGPIYYGAVAGLPARTPQCKMPILSGSCTYCPSKMLDGGSYQESNFTLPTYGYGLKG